MRDDEVTKWNQSSKSLKKGNQKNHFVLRFSLQKHFLYTRVSYQVCLKAFEDGLTENDSSTDVTKFESISGLVLSNRKSNIKVVVDGQVTKKVWSSNKTIESSKCFLVNPLNLYFSLKTNQLQILTPNKVRKWKKIIASLYSLYSFVDFTRYRNFDFFKVSLWITKAPFFRF